MLLGSFLGWIIAGLVVGALARFFVPGRQDMDIIMTIILGIVGALVGGFISSLLFGPNVMVDSTGTYVVATAWPGWIMAVIGGVIVLAGYLAITNKSTTSR